MTKNLFIEKSNKINLTGDVIEIYEKDNEKIAKVFFKSLCLEVEINSLKDVHLSDRLKLETRFIIDKAEKENHY